MLFFLINFVSSLFRSHESATTREIWLLKQIVITCVQAIDRQDSTGQQILNKLLIFLGEALLLRLDNMLEIVSLFLYYLRVYVIYGD